MNTDQVARSLNVARPVLQALIRKIGMKPKQAIQDSRVHNQYTPAQVEELRSRLSPRRAGKGE